jgi:hypothetical protein
VRRSSYSCLAAACFSCCCWRDSMNGVCERAAESRDRCAFEDLAAAPSFVIEAFIALKADGTGSTGRTRACHRRAYSNLDAGQQSAQRALLQCPVFAPHPQLASWTMISIFGQPIV